MPQNDNTKSLYISAFSFGCPGKMDRVFTRGQNFFENFYFFPHEGRICGVLFGTARRGRTTEKQRWQVALVKSMGTGKPAN